MILSVWKRNDQINGVRNGFLADVIDTDEQIDGFEISDAMHGPFLLMQHPKSHKAKLREQINVNDIDKVSSKHYIDFADIETKLNRPNLVSDCRTSKQIETLDGSLLSLDTVLKTVDKYDYTKTYLTDVLAFTGGSATVGSGGTYATLVAMTADLGGFTSNGLITIISDTSEGSATGSSNACGVYDFEVTSDTLMAGDVTAGHTVTHTHGGQFGWYIASSGSGQCKLHGFKFTNSHANGGLFAMAFAGDPFVYNMYFDGNSKGDNAALQNRVPDTWIYNCAIYNSADDGIDSINSANFNIYNNFVYNNSVLGFDGNISSNTLTMRSNIFFDNGTSVITGSGGPTIENNASTDAVMGAANGNLQNLTAANECDLTVSNATFGHPLASPANIDTGGNTTQLSAAGANGVAWEVDPSIGFIQWAAAASSGTIVPNIINYLRQRRAA